jgi:hypothetical protein
MTARERPILFSAPMVRAILDGSKTQTRRVVKPQPRILAGDLLCWKDDALTDDQMALRCPYGKPGDRLWVREAWHADSDVDHLPPRDIPEGSHVWFKAGRGLSAIRGLSRMGKTRPGMFMPRWASRITLEVTGIRVERLQDISDEDSLSEGVYPTSTGLYPGSPRAAYQKLWEQLHGLESWDANPWVWVVEFRRLP